MKSRTFQSSDIERLTSFMAPEEGEALLGVLTRGYARFGEDVSSFMTAMIGKIRCKGTLDPAMPTYTARVSSAMPATHPLADHAVLLRNHTALPYYLFFAPAERRATVIETLGDLHTTNLSCVLGFSTARLKPTPHARVCRKCLARDMKKGAPTFHIDHQLPTTWVCPEHGDVLTDGCEICGREPRRGGLLDLAGTCGDHRHTERLPCITFDEAERCDLEWIARQGERMLSCYEHAPENPLARLRAIALTRHARGAGLNGESLARAIEARFSPVFLQRLGLAFSSDRDRLSGWHRQLLTKTSADRLKEPAQCLVVLGALLEGIDEFLSWEPRAEAEEFVRPRPSWESELEMALVVSNGALQPVTKLYGITFNRLWRAMVEQGLTVERRAPLPVSEDDYQRILRCWQEGVDQKRMMIEFGVSEHLLKMMVLWEPGLFRCWLAARRNSRLEPYRVRIADFVKAHPGAGRNRVRTALTTEFEAIEEADPAWIAANIPRRQGNHRNADGTSRPRKDWAERDQAYAAAIDAWVRRHFEQDEKPVHLTATFLLRQVGHPMRYYLNIERHPLTQQVLQGCCEDIDAYRRRRLLWAARQCAHAMLPLKADVVRRMAGFERKHVNPLWAEIVAAYDAAGGPVLACTPARKPRRAGSGPSGRTRAARQNVGLQVGLPGF